MGQDLDNPTDWAGDGPPEARPAKVPPKSGRGVPVEIINKDGSSKDKVSLASKDEFVRKEGDNERNPENDIVAAARLALRVEGLRPSNKARAMVARLPGAVIMRRALAALRDDTQDEVSLAAASGSKAAAQATLHDGMKPDEEADFGANWQAKKGGHTSKEAGRATKRKCGGTHSLQVLTPMRRPTLRPTGRPKRGLLEWRGRLGQQEEGQSRGPPKGWDMQPPSVDGVVWFHRGKNQGKTGQGGSTANFLLAPRKAGDPHAEAWLQAERDHKEAAHAGAHRKTNHVAHQGGGMRSPQLLMALFGSTVGKNQGKTGQSGSAAVFLPDTGTQYEKETTIAQGARAPRHRLSLAASAKDEDPPNNAGMAKLGQNMSVLGTMAA